MDTIQGAYETKNLSNIGEFGVKNIRKSTITFSTLLMVSFLTPSTAFATSDDDLDDFGFLESEVKKLFLPLRMPKKVQQSETDIVIIYGPHGNGSGFVVRDKKRNRFLLVTAWHVMEQTLKKPEHMKIEHETEELKIKEILTYSEKYDVFIGVLENYTGRGLTFAHSPNYNSNEMYILGFPHGRFATHDGQGIDLESTSYFKIVTNTEKNLKGGSGSPILNNEGEVIGIHQNGNSIHISGALKSEYFKDLLFGTNTSKTEWEQAGFVVIEKPFKEAIKDIKIPEYYEALYSPFSIEDNLPRLKQIADNGSPVAQLSLSLVLDDIDNPFRPEPSQEQIKDAIRYLKMAAIQGHDEAIISLAERLYKGDSIPQNKSEAADWFRLIIEEHDRHPYTPTAMLNLAKMLEEGDSIPQNKPKAAQLYEQVIKIKNDIFETAIEARRRLAKMLEKGDGIPQDRQRARLLQKEAEEEAQLEEHAQRAAERIKARRKALSQEEPKPASSSQNIECAESFGSNAENKNSQ